ncbi:MAG TPA: hypothetical protein VFC51_02015 [Chloroflexota bacterium]|nr:hypothetical protein [Chloroflexota bacterium]
MTILDLRAGEEEFERAVALINAARDSRTDYDAEVPSDSQWDAVLEMDGLLWGAPGDSPR